MNLATLTRWGYYQILNIGVSLSRGHGDAFLAGISCICNMINVLTLSCFKVNLILLHMFIYLLSLFIFS